MTKSDTDGSHSRKQEEAKERIDKGINPIQEKREKRQLQLEKKLEKERKEEVQTNVFQKVAQEWPKTVRLW